MTVSTAGVPFEGPFEGDGQVSRFTYRFRGFGIPEYVAVWVQPPDGKSEMLELGVDYTVTSTTWNESGRIDFLPEGKYPNLPVGYLLAIAGVFPENQGIPFRAAERFFAVNHEIGYDYVTMLVKQLRRDIQRVFDIPDSPFEAPRIWINGMTLEEYVKMLAEREVEKAFGPKDPIFVTESELFLDADSHRCVYIIVNECTIYVPSGMPVGWTCDFQRAGSGSVTFDSPEGMVWWSVDISKTIQHQYAWANLMCVSDKAMSLSGDVYGKGNEDEPGVAGPGEFTAINGQWKYIPLDGFDLAEKMALYNDPDLFDDPDSFVEFTDVKGRTRSVRANDMILTHVSGLFRTFYNLEWFNQNVDEWDTSTQRSMNGTFERAIRFNRPLPWVTSACTSFAGFARGASAFNQPLNFDMRRATTISGILKDAVEFNDPSISGWELDSLEDARNALDGALSFNQPIGGWSMGKVHPRYTEGTLSWLTTYMDRMLADTPAFDQDLTGWCVSRYWTGIGPKPPVEFAEGSGLSPGNFPIWGTCPGED